MSSATERSIEARCQKALVRRVVTHMTRRPFRDTFERIAARPLMSQKAFRAREPTQAEYLHQPSCERSGYRSEDMPLPVKPLARRLVPGALVVGAVVPRVPRRWRLASIVSLAALWTRAYVKYRLAGREQTRREWELLRTASWEAYTRHYHERVP